MTDAYRSFFNNFGSGYRTKHIRLQWANPALRIFGREPKRAVRPCSVTTGPITFPGTAHCLTSSFAWIRGRDSSTS
jgi:hypothetical protein